MPGRLRPGIPVALETNPPPQGALMTGRPVRNPPRQSAALRAASSRGACLRFRYAEARARHLSPSRHPPWCRSTLAHLPCAASFDTGFGQQPLFRRGRSALQRFLVFGPLSGTARFNLGRTRGFRCPRFEERVLVPSGAASYLVAFRPARSFFLPLELSLVRPWRLVTSARFRAPLKRPKPSLGHPSLL